MAKLPKKQFNDLKVNHGLPEGMKLKDLVPGAIVTVRWNDSEDTRYCVVEVDKHPKTFKGDREFKVIDSSFTLYDLRISATQIVSYHGNAVDKNILFSK